MKPGSRFFAKWLIVILLMAIGIGTFAALSIRNEKEKEANEASPSSYLTNQRQHDIDLEELKKIVGDYQEEKSSWHLLVSEEYEGKGPYLSVYDNGAGNPGFEGRIMYLKAGIVIVEIDTDLFEEMPAEWEPEGDGKYAILDYSLTDEGIRLGYRGNELDFVVEEHQLFPGKVMKPISVFI